MRWCCYEIWLCSRRCLQSSCWKSCFQNRELWTWADDQPKIRRHPFSLVKSRVDHFDFVTPSAGTGKELDDGKTKCCMFRSDPWPLAWPLGFSCACDARFRPTIELSDAGGPWRPNR